MSRDGRFSLCCSLLTVAVLLFALMTCALLALVRFGLALSWLFFDGNRFSFDRFSFALFRLDCFNRRGGFRLTCWRNRLFHRGGSRHRRSMSRNDLFRRRRRVYMCSDGLQRSDACCHMSGRIDLHSRLHSRCLLRSWLNDHFGFGNCNDWGRMDRNRRIVDKLRSIDFFGWNQQIPLTTANRTHSLVCTNDEVVEQIIHALTTHTRAAMRGHRRGRRRN